MDRVDVASTSPPTPAAVTLAVMPAMSTPASSMAAMSSSPFHVRPRSLGICR
jgi:hypothetical protein